MVEVDAASTSMRPSQLEVHKEVTELSASEAVGEHGDGIKLRRTNKKNYYIQSLEEVEAADELAMAAAAEEAAANALLNGSTNGRSVRSTRNQKSMRESTPPPLRGPSGPMYNGPFIHPKR